jgi:aromatic ring hydroxylase
MKSKRMFAIASVMTAISAASGQAPAPAPAATAAPAPAPATAPPKLDQKAPPRAARVSIVDADARNCLEFPSNEEVIKCAEKYLHRRAG